MGMVSTDHVLNVGRLKRYPDMLSVLLDEVVVTLVQDSSHLC